MTANQDQQRGCRECGEIYVHRITCPLHADNCDDSIVIESERVEGERVDRHDYPLCCRLAIAVQDSPIVEGKQLSCDCGNVFKFKDSAWRMVNPFASRPSPTPVHPPVEPLLECPSCSVHLHLDPCCDNCAKARAAKNKAGETVSPAPARGPFSDLLDRIPDGSIEVSAQEYADLTGGPAPQTDAALATESTASPTVELVLSEVRSNVP